MLRIVVGVVLGFLFKEEIKATLDSLKEKKGGES